MRAAADNTPTTAQGPKATTAHRGAKTCAGPIRKTIGKASIKRRILARPARYLAAFILQA
ncbi:MAG: hypothetical protein CMH08_10985 [Marinovum sp.]|nr:hypothetical protein [Marinovum sp.]